MTKAELQNKIAVLLGGRVAEEIIYKEVSTGAQDDLMKATDIAKSMVKVYGMSEKLGQISFDRSRHPAFFQPGQLQAPTDYSEDTSREIDCEVRRFIEEQHDRVTTLLAAQEDTLRQAAGILLKKEVLGGEELKKIVAGSLG